MGVVPERADLLGSKAVDVALAGQDGVLRDACDTVLGIRHVDSVPVDGHALLDVGVRELDLDEVALLHAELRAWRRPVERQSLDGSLGGETDLGAPRGQLEAGIGRARPRAVQILHAGPVCAAVRGVPGRLGAAAEVVVAERHDVVGLGQSAVVPRLAEEAEDGNEQDDGRDGGDPAYESLRHAAASYVSLSSAP